MISRIKNSIFRLTRFSAADFLIRLLITLPLHVYSQFSSRRRSFVETQHYSEKQLSDFLGTDRRHKQGKADRPFRLFVIQNNRGLFVNRRIRFETVSQKGIEKMRQERKEVQQFPELTSFTLSV